MNKKIQTLMNTAKLWAKESYCKRKQVGAVLAKDDRILATGYNGTISGLENKCEEEVIIYNNKKYKSIFNIIKDYKIKLLNKRYYENEEYFYLLKLNFELIDNTKTKGYFYLNDEQYFYLKELFYENTQEYKKEVLNKYYNLEYEFSKILKFYIKKEIVTSDLVLHAEQNVITFCAKNGIPTEGTELFVTLSPCSNCAKLIVQSGIKKVYYNEEYRDTSGIDFLKEVGVEVEKI